VRLFLISLFLIFTNIYTVFGETIKPDWWYNSCYYECYSIFGCHLFCDEIRKFTIVVTNIWFEFTGSEKLPIDSFYLFCILLLCFIFVFITLICTIIDIKNNRELCLISGKEVKNSSNITLLNIFQIISLILGTFLLICVLIYKIV
jgi:hypothetical protein